MISFGWSLVVLGVIAVIVLWNIRSGSKINRSISDRDMAAFAKIPYWAHPETDEEIIAKMIDRMIHKPEEDALANTYYRHYLMRKFKLVIDEMRADDKQV